MFGNNNKDPYGNPITKPRRKRVIIIGILIGMAVISILLFASSSQRSKGTPKKTPNTAKQFSNSYFTIYFPDGYKQDSGGNSTSTATFKPENQSGDSTMDLISVARYGSNSITTESLLALVNGDKSIQTEQKDINKRKTIIFKQTQTNDSKQTIVTTSYYVYADVYIWRIQFTNLEKSKQASKIEDIIQSFAPNDADLVKLQGN